VQLPVHKDLVRTKHHAHSDGAGNTYGEIRDSRPSPNHRVFFIEYQNLILYVWWIEMDLLAPVTN